MSTDDSLVDGVLRADKRSVARALNLVESRRAEDVPAIASLLDALSAGRSVDAGHRVGFTGPPGVGKSTLAASLAKELRARERTLGIVAVDPTSVLSGGSLLGDRARMNSLSGDPGVFVRSYATAGETGGVTSTVLAAIAVMAAAYDLVLVETVGVGQTETDVRMLVDTVVLVLQPGSGDTLQFLKAGIMEIPDVLVVQKADHDELARRALADLGSALRTARSVGLGRADAWEPPTIATSALSGRGIAELADAMDRHRSAIAADLPDRRARGAVEWAVRQLARTHGTYAVERLGGASAVHAWLRSEQSRGLSAVSLAARASHRYLTDMSSTAAGRRTLESQ